MLSTRTVNAYKLAIGLLVFWTMGITAIATFIFPGALTASDDDRPPRTVVIRATTDPSSPYWGVAATVSK